MDTKTVRKRTCALFLATALTVTFAQPVRSEPVTVGVLLGLKALAVKLGLVKGGSVVVGSKAAGIGSTASHMTTVGAASGTGAATGAGTTALTVVGTGASVAGLWYAHQEVAYAKAAAAPEEVEAVFVEDDLPLNGKAIDPRLSMSFEDGIADAYLVGIKRQDFDEQLLTMYVASDPILKADDEKIIVGAFSTKERADSFANLLKLVSNGGLDVFQTNQKVNLKLDS